MNSKQNSALNNILSKIKIQNLEIENDIFRFDYKDNRFRVNVSCGLVERVEGSLLISDKTAYNLSKKLGYK